MTNNSSRRVDDEENDAKEVIFLYQMHRSPSTKVILTFGENENNS